MNLTIDQAMNALEVPADKREKYRKTYNESPKRAGTNFIKSFPARTKFK